jgi:creatinine amidohydrolase/Fe(II)-dependent formamide hydrolase-like protein
MSFRLHHKCWVTVSEGLEESDTVIAALGSLDAHGAHKPVGCCCLLAEATSLASWRPLRGSTQAWSDPP